MPEANDCKLMFLAAQEFSNGSVVRGGILVTDNQTKPVEFRCTNPIRPTALQKILYGRLLDTHILVSLIAMPLVRSATEKASFVLIRDKRLLELQDKIDIPVIWLGRNEEDTDAGEEADSSPLIISETGKYEPIVVRGAQEMSKETKEARQILTAIFARHNLLEPFDRVKTALEQVHSQKSGDNQ